MTWLPHVVAQRWHTHTHSYCSLAAFILPVWNLILSSPAPAPGSQSCGAPPGTSGLLPVASSSFLPL